MIKVFVVDRGARYSEEFTRFEAAVRFMLKLPRTAVAELCVSPSLLQVAA